jgi:hypothetical protein
MVSQEISDSKDQIAGYLRDTDDINASIALSRGSIEQARSELTGDLIELKSLLQGVREESRELGSIVSNIPPRLERVETGMEGIFSLLQAPQTESTQRNREDPSKESFAKEFLNRSSLDLNLLIIALCQSASSNNLITQVAPRRASRAHRLVRIYQSDHVAQCHPVPERPFPA